MHITSIPETLKFYALMPWSYDGQQPLQIGSSHATHPIVDLLQFAFFSSQVLGSPLGFTSGCLA
jgi:hypothetical protein